MDKTNLSLARAGMAYLLEKYGIYQGLVEENFVIPEADAFTRDEVQVRKHCKQEGGAILFRTPHGKLSLYSIRDIQQLWQGIAGELNGLTIFDPDPRQISFQLRFRDENGNILHPNDQRSYQKPHAELTATIAGKHYMDMLWAFAKYATKHALTLKSEDDVDLDSDIAGFLRSLFEEQDGNQSPRR